MRQVACFRKENCALARGFCSGKTWKKKLLCMRSLSFHLLAWLDCYQFCYPVCYTQTVPFFHGSMKNEPTRILCIVFCSLGKPLSLRTASCWHARHTRLGAASSVQQSKEGNCEMKLSNVRPERYHLRSTIASYVLWKTARSDPQQRISFSSKRESANLEAKTGLAITSLRLCALLHIAMGICETLV